jgi:hypothetical protein
MAEKKKVLITVKTYPLPSVSYQELVCTAGVLEDGSFIRLYPVDYRYQPYWKWYKKYQWIEVEVTKHDRTDDPRKESYRPEVESIRILSDPLSTKNCWEERKRVVLSRGTRTMEELWTLQKTEGTSLGIIRPKEIGDFLIEPVEEDWKPQWKRTFQQLRLFGPRQKPLEKIPFKFSYVFRCDNAACKGHTMMIEDWEIGALYLKMRDKYGSSEIAIQKVRQRFFDQMCDPVVDTHFFVGNVRKYPTWIILGVFWPKKVNTF